MAVERSAPLPGLATTSAIPDFAVVATGLRKTFGAKVAVDSIDLRVEKGAFFGVVGPNGAGKTTTLRMITCLLKPEAGHVWVDGVDVWANPQIAKAHFGVLPDDLRLFERLSGKEFLTYVGLLRRLSRGEATRRADELLSVLGLHDAANELTADYSQGMRKKIGLGAAILHMPAVLFLDEPFESVDPVSVRVITEVLQHYRSSGGTVVFSSHVMETVQRLCDEVVIVHAGNIVASGPIAEVCAGRSLEQAFIDAVGAKSIESASLSWMTDGLEAVATQPQLA